MGINHFVSMHNAILNVNYLSLQSSAFSVSWRNNQQCYRHIYLRKIECNMQLNTSLFNNNENNTNNAMKKWYSIKTVLITYSRFASIWKFPNKIFNINTKNAHNTVCLVQSVFLDVIPFANAYKECEAKTQFLSKSDWVEY